MLRAIGVTGTSDRPAHRPVGSFTGSMRTKRADFRGAEPGRSRESVNPVAVSGTRSADDDVETADIPSMDEFEFRFG